jgi:hypothetical protein
MYTKNKEQEEDALLDSLMTLEMNCHLTRVCLKLGRLIAFERLFQRFFPKEIAPNKFEPLARCFSGKDDPTLAYRHSALRLVLKAPLPWP